MLSDHAVEERAPAVRNPLVSGPARDLVVVKDQVGRRRYIAFEPPQPRPSRHELNRRLGPRSWRLTVYTGEVGILRVPHVDAETARSSLAEEGATPLTTSGTIRAAKERAGVLGT